ncbi:MAG: hypothetical protein DWP97_05935 [Calditrichaeota bacterium]|nr:MAG: hypothetical protein DWP97_05935 [Calditrichota bacterium]
MVDDNSNDDRTQSFVVLAAGEQVSHYKIIKKIGAGGMGEIYLADDTKLDRKVALKFMPNHLASDSDMRVRFTREAQATAKLDHPNIVPVYEVGEFKNRPFFVMAHIEGKPLRDVIKEGKLTVLESIELTKQISEGLQNAHEAGIVHRDIKPGNIIIDKSGRPRILDFGLATVSGEDKLTKTGSTLGTVGYMSPEQISGKKVDKRSDIFSLGVILYEMITGRRPFTGDNDAAVLKSITDTSPEPIARFKSGSTGELQQIISKAIAKDPSVRYQHADGMLADLKRLSFDSETVSKRIPYWLVASAVIIIILVFFISSYFVQSDVESYNEIQPVLIVLPFENLGDEVDDYFSNGIRFEINTRLSEIKGLSLISPRTAEKYHGDEYDFQQIREETGATYVLEATILWDRSGEVSRFRINPILTKTDDNYLMWSDRFDQEMTQVFEVQSEIAGKIVTALGLTLLTPDEQAPDYAPTTNMEAYNYYLRGLEVSSHSFKTADFYESIRMFDSAIVLDPNFTLAWAQKSINQSTFYFFFTTIDSKHHKNEALAAAEKAMALDPDNPHSKIAMGTYYNYIDQDYEKALELLYAAKSEIINNADLSEAIGVVKMRQGKWKESLTYFEEAIKIDPLNHRRYFFIANNLSMTRDYDEAERYVDRALVLNPKNEDAAYMKIFIEQLRTGKVEYDGAVFSRLVNDVGLAEISAYELVSTTSFGLWRYIIDEIDPQKAIADVRELGKYLGTITARSPHTIQFNLAQLFDLIGQRDSAFIYYDSTRILLQDVIDQGDFEFHAVAELGLSYAFMGMKKEAIEAGKRSKEMMSIETCHW